MDKLVSNFMLNEFVVHHLTLSDGMGQQTDWWKDLSSFIAGHVAFVEKKWTALLSKLTQLAIFRSMEAAYPLAWGAFLGLQGISVYSDQGVDKLFLQVFARHELS